MLFLAVNYLKQRHFSTSMIISDKLMKKTFKGKDILVTGGCGSIGSEIVRQLLKYEPKRIRVLDHDESAQFHMSQSLKKSKIVRHLIGDVRDKDRIKRAIRGVDLIFHAAALKHVPLCEYNPYEAVRTNVVGTQNLIDVAIEEKVDKLLAISTDKAVNPINTMGATKLLSEKLTTTSHGDTKLKSSCVRFGNVLNSDGSVIPIFRKQIHEGGPVTITSDKMTRFFMSISEAVELVLKSMVMMKGSEIFILKMNALKIKDLAEVMIEELAPKYDLKPESIKIKTIGVRPGEKLSECLITEEETEHLSENKSMFILRPPIIAPQFSEEFKAKRRYEEYDSANIPKLSKERIRKLLYHYKIIE